MPRPANRNDDMTNQIALALALIVIALFVIDAALFGGNLPISLGKRFAGLIEYLSFWR